MVDCLAVDGLVVDGLVDGLDVDGLDVEVDGLGVEENCGSGCSSSTSMPSKSGK